MRRGTALWFTGLLVCGGVTDAGAGVHVALLPSSGQVAPGAEFDVRLRVTQEGDVFNAYTAVIRYDPTALTFVPQSGSAQEGSYMVLACGSTSQSCTPAPAQVSISHTLLCLGMTLTGPGDLYVLRFRAANTSQFTALHFDRIQFYHSGYFTALSEALDGFVQIGNASDANAGSPAISPQVRIAPNPFSGSTSFRVEWPGQQAVARVFDARGQLVRSLTAAPYAASHAFRAEWDARDDSGVSVAAGRYWIVVSDGIRTATGQAVLLR